MRKIVLFSLVFSWGVLVQTKTPSKAADFSGKWILDISHTKKVPDGLDSYGMSVTQNAHEIKVVTTVRGDIQPEMGPTGTSPQPRARVGPPGGYPGGGEPMGGPGTPAGGVGGPEVPVGGAGTIGGQGVPVGREPITGPQVPVGGAGPMAGPGVSAGGGPMGEGIPGSTEPSGGSGGEARTDRNAPTAVAAFTMYPRSAVYKLDGGESNVQLGDPARTQATAKAAWVKGDKQLKLSLAGNESAERGGEGIAVKEQWRLSKDGEYLLIDRTVRTPGQSTTIHLIFKKQ
jgi:hypothetical protein